MDTFIIRFLLCNVLICALISLLMLVKYLLRRTLTARTQYRLWFLLLGLLAVPFLPSGLLQCLPLFSLSSQSARPSVDLPKTAADALRPGPDAAAWMHDIGLSVSRKTPAWIGTLLFVLWAAGIVLMLFFLAVSLFRWNRLKKSALPLQNAEIQKLYRRCLAKMHITKNIPIHSTAFLKSPVLAGWIRPCIYLPIRLILDFHKDQIRFMLLHELQHFRHKDAPANYLMHAACILYWFNPFVWRAMQEMKDDRETACDASVLQTLKETEYKDYGDTLLAFAGQLSAGPFPFTAGIIGSRQQLNKRIRAIADFAPPSFSKNLRSAAAFVLTAVFLAASVPFLSAQAADSGRYSFDEKGRNISYIDLSADFHDKKGSFVLYDAAEDAWIIYNKTYAAARISPASTYKIYIALNGLESGIISPQHSEIPWDGLHYAVPAWNASQTLESAMKNSVNWYFQAIDRQAGSASIQSCLQKTGYGSQTMGSDLSSYWADSTLTISPVEQVELLKKLYDNEFGFREENITAVKDSLLLSSDSRGAIYGKTGTESVNGQNISGWFIGFIEKNSRPCFFALNIQSKVSASGAEAAELAFSILSQLNFL